MELSCIIQITNNIFRIDHTPPQLLGLFKTKFQIKCVVTDEFPILELQTNFQNIVHPHTVLATGFLSYVLWVYWYFVTAGTQSRWPPRSGEDDQPEHEWVAGFLLAEKEKTELTLNNMHCLLTAQ